MKESLGLNGASTKEFIRDKELVSVIVPIYNADRYVDACVSSIIKQTYENIEIILVDDGSTDKSSIVCAALALRDNRVVIVSKRNGGVSSARNAGLELASGGYVMFVDADDLIGEHLIEYLMSVSSGADIVVSSLRSFTDENAVDISSQHQPLDGFTLLDNRTARINMLYQKTIQNIPCAKLYSRDVIRGVVFDESIGIAEDLLFNFMVMANAKAVAVSDYTGYYYRNHEHSAMNRAFSLGRMTGLVATDKILQLSTGDTALARAAENRHFMEALFIAFRLPRRGYDTSRTQCTRIINKFKRRVLLDRSSRLRIRQYALISYLGFNIVTSLANIYSRVRKVFRTRLKRVIQKRA